MPEGLLKTKLYPPPHPSQVTRQPLLEKFALARQGGITCALVSAPAGFGKTTLMADCARASGLPFAWLALDEGDNDLLRFWRYLDAALAAIDGQIGAGLRPALYAAQAPAIEQIITGLVNDVVSLEQELILVLDDYHAIELSAIHDSMNYLLDHLPPRMCVVIITRSDPPLNLARRRGRGQLVEIRANDLRFSAEETAALLNGAMRLDVAEADIASLARRTEGWIAGLQMAALSMRDETDPHSFVAAFSGDDRHIADYLVEEVLQRQLVEVQRFLLQTSILDQLSAPLCDAVTGRPDSRVMLNTLERANLFLLPLDNRREWFRYHHLFADLLRQRLRETCGPEALADLHRAAANWYEAQGDIPAAIRHAQAIADEQSILRMLTMHAGRLFGGGELPRLFELASLLPPGPRKESPMLCITVAWAGLACNHYAEVPPWLEAIEAHFGLPAEGALSDPTLSPATRAALLEVLVIRLQLPTARQPAGQLKHILAIREQLNALPPGQVCLLNTVDNLKPVIAFNLGQHAESTGDLALAAQTLAEAITLCRQTLNSDLLHLALAHFANTQAAQGQLRAAGQSYRQSLAEPVKSPFVSLAHAGLAALQLEWGDFEAARGHIAAGLAQARLWNLWEALLPLTLAAARLHQCLGEIQAAVDVLNEAAPPPLPGQELPLRAAAALLNGADSARAWLTAHPGELRLEPDPANEAHLLTVARLAALAGRADEALPILRKVIGFARNGGRNHMLVQASTALAVIAGEPETLLEALRLAEPEGYLTVFRLEGEPLENMLQHLLRQANLDPYVEAYVRRIPAGLEPAAHPARPAGGLVEPLSEREIEVLRHIADGLSNSEIARRLYLSTNTLKAHTQNIYMKLDVHSRLQAVSKAKELGLID